MLVDAGLSEGWLVTRFASNPRALRFPSRPLASPPSRAVLPSSRRRAARLVVVDAVRSLAQRLCRKSIGLALRWPVEEGDKLTCNDEAPIRLRSDVGGNQALGLDAERGVDTEGGFEFGGSIDHGVSFGECGAYWGIIALRAKSSVGVRFASCCVSSSVQPCRPSSNVGLREDKPAYQVRREAARG